eukprot:14076263-Alexandrium_andersonii.AAC.1
MAVSNIPQLLANGDRFLRISPDGGPPTSLDPPPEWRLRACWKRVLVGSGRAATPLEGSGD